MADEGEHHSHHGSRNYGPVERGYYERAPQYAPPSSRYNGYDQRSHQGLAGGVIIGSVLGYELGAGNPIASGMGAATGSYLGNGMADKATG